MRAFFIATLLLVAACMPTTSMVGLPAESIPEAGIYSPMQVIVVEHGQDYEFAAASLATFTREQVAEVAYCRASMFANANGYSGWFIKDEIENVTPRMREVNVIATFYRGDKPYLVSNKNTINWCRGQQDW